MRITGTINGVAVPSLDRLQPVANHDGIRSRRWEAFDPVRNYPDLGVVFSRSHARSKYDDDDPGWVETVELDDTRDLSWATVTKRTLEAWVRGERPNLYGEWFVL
jgi:hypothetical protein